MIADQPKTTKLALEALAQVEKGSSERSAVQRVIKTRPGLIGVRREALALVLQTLDVQDQLDLIICRIAPSGAIGKKKLALLRIAVHLLLQTTDSETVTRIEKEIRYAASVEEIPLLELLIGTVPTLDKNSLTRSMGDFERLAIETHYPRWWVEYCSRVFGRDEAIKLLSASPRPRYVRVNSLKNRGRTSFPAKLKRLSSWMNKVLVVPPVYSLKSSLSEFSDYFSEGLLQVQDLASFLAVKAAEPASEERVLDLCAAPGAKTATLAQLMKNRGRIISVDYSRTRMQSWRREVQRLGVKIAEPIIESADSLSFSQKFDLVLVDPPCTGTGILDRNPAMKWHLTPQLLERYAGLQSRFLDSAASLVAEGGRILYCTCSLSLEENERVVRSFMNSHPDFETIPILEGQGMPGLEGLRDCRRFWPHRDSTAGYFVARLQRVA